MSDPIVAPATGADKLVQKVKETAKAWIALISMILTTVVGFIPTDSPWAKYVAIAIAVVGAIATWATPNALSEKQIAAAAQVIDARNAPIDPSKTVPDVPVITTAPEVPPILPAITDTSGHV